MVAAAVVAHIVQAVQMARTGQARAEQGKVLPPENLPWLLARLRPAVAAVAVRLVRTAQAMVLLVAPAVPQRQTLAAVAAVRALATNSLAVWAALAKLRSETTVLRKGGEKMQYALIDGGAVVNIIEIAPANASEFPSAVPVLDVQAEIGDSYTDGAFWRRGVRLPTPMEAAQATIAELDRGVLELELANVMLGLGM